MSISFTPVVSKVTQSAGAFIDWANLPSGSEGVKEALTMYNSIGANALDQVKVTTLQANLDQLIHWPCRRVPDPAGLQAPQEEGQPDRHHPRSLRHRHHWSRLRLHVSTFRLKTENC